MCNTPSKTVLPQSWMSLYTETYYNDTCISTATGFVVEATNNKKFLLTNNRHVVTGKDNQTDKCLHKLCAIPNKLKIFFNQKPNISGIYGQWIPKELNLYDNNKIPRPMWVEHPKFKGAIDVVAIELPYLDKVDYCPYILDSTFDIQLYPSDYLSVVGFPFNKKSYGYLAIWTIGFLASDIDIDHDNLPLFLIDCRTRTGQSGSPVIVHRNGGTFINKAGNSCIIVGIKSKLLDIYSGRINMESDLGYVWKLSVIREIIEQNKC